ncbi:alpha/beta fold hydrolase [Roseomonas sp. BN140053]|uniref:alpha/beta fold hydrolase n=1 Tax=Roseomonas sp. BN140053 TaxID=3391898 RepID=UPI0039EBAE52
MPLAEVRGIHINYEVIGEGGAWVSLSPGSRRPYDELVPIARALAAEGHRVLLHDRRNCGASDVAIEGEESEYEIWADDLHALLQHLGARSAFVGGSSAGCRLAILFALRHPEAAKGLLLWRVTGGHTAAERLAETYYGQFIEAARRGGMAAVCDTEHFRERIEARPENRARLIAMRPEEFIRVMSHWKDYFTRGADQPVIGASEADLRSIRAPVLLVPGNDVIHTPVTAEAVARLFPRNEVHHVVAQGRGPGGGLLEDWDRAEWKAAEGELARLFGDFIRRVEAAPAETAGAG